jgi:hypothetical protein
VADAAGTVVGGFEFHVPRNTSGNTRVGYVSAVTEGTTANNRGAFVEIASRPDGGSAAVSRMRFASGGEFGISNTSIGPAIAPGLFGVIGGGTRDVIVQLQGGGGADKQVGHSYHHTTNEWAVLMRSTGTLTWAYNPSSYTDAAVAAAARLTLGTGGLSITGGLVISNDVQVGSTLQVIGVTTLNGNVTANNNVSVNGTLSAKGADTQVQYNKTGNLAGESTFTYDDASDILRAANVYVSNQVVAFGLVGNYQQLTGPLSMVNSINTVGQGLPILIARRRLTNQNAALIQELVASLPAEGMYRVSYAARVVVPATTSSVLGGTNGFYLGYTSPEGVAAINTPLGQGADKSTLNSVTAGNGGQKYCYAKAATQLFYAFDYTSVGATAMQYNLELVVEFLGSAVATLEREGPIPPEMLALLQGPPVIQE